MSASILAVIPARGGSKAVPRKNLRPLGGKPLFAHMLEAALGSTLVSKVAVSSEDTEVLEAARQWGKGKAEVIERPAALAQDDTPSLPVIVHAVEELEKKHGTFDYVVMLQATTPFVRTEDIDNALKLLMTDGTDSVFSVCKATSYHPTKIKKITADNRLVQYLEGLTETQFTRQKLDPVYRRNGGIYAHKRDIVMTKGQLYGSDSLVCRPYVMSEERSVDINSMADFIAAEALLKYLNDGGKETF